MLRPALFALAIVACLLLAIAEFSDLNDIRVITVTLADASVGVGSHHGYALLIVAVVAVVMAYGAYRGSRPAGLALAVLGAVALAVVLLVDLPDIDATGIYGRDYEQATSEAATGFYLETAGAILLFATGVLTAVLGRPAPPPPRPPREPAPA